MSKLYINYKLKNFFKKHKVKLVAMGMISFIIFFETYKKIEKQKFDNLNISISDENYYEKNNELTENELNLKNRIESKIDEIETLKDDFNKEYIIYEYFTYDNIINDDLSYEYQTYTIKFDTAVKLGISDLLDSKLINTKKIS